MSFTRSQTQRPSSTSAVSHIRTGTVENLNDLNDDGDEAGTEALPASDVTIYNSYNMGPAFGKKFPVSYIRFTLSQLTSERLSNKVYNQADALKWARELADAINLKLKGPGGYAPRFKRVVNVMLYQQTGAGCFYGARAIWDQLSDDYESYTYDGGSFVCIVSVFGCYQY